MNIDFGIVKNFFPDKGFGFVSHTFLSGNQSGVFFHIRNIRKSNFDLAEKLNSSESVGAICFWYETEQTAKGDQVRNIVKSEVIERADFDNLSTVFKKVEDIWNDLNSSIPFWLRQVTVDLVGDEQAQEIYLQRVSFEEERKKREIEEYKKIIDRKKDREKLVSEHEKNETGKIIKETGNILIFSNIDFGVVSKYFPEKGFGFVSHVFLEECRDQVFFHINNVRSTDSKLASNLNNSESISDICFWYEVEHTNKGDQIKNILSSDLIRSSKFDNLSLFFKKVEYFWNNLDCPIPFWLNQVTVDLVGDDRAKEIYLNRVKLEEIKNKEREDLLKKEKERYRIESEEKEAGNRIMDNEFNQLVEEMKNLGFTQSRQVSQYIMNNNLGSKYKNISGIVEMEKEGTRWSYQGGFPSKIYARLCAELGLHNQGSRARAVSFTSFKDL